VILIDGELVAASPSLQLSFGSHADGPLTSLRVRAGQRVQKGDLIATIDDAEMQQAVDDARLALDRATKDQVKADADADKEYERQHKQAQEAYEKELLDARRALEAAQAALERARMQPPTTSLAEAKTDLARARIAEENAHDEYKQALDRPWEPQRIRDNLYNDWQTRIQDRVLAELRLQDAQIALQVHQLDLETKARDVENAEADLERVQMDEIEREDTSSYQREVEDAERQLADAEANLADAQLYAPWNGLILSIDASLSATVTGSTPIVTMVDVDELYFVTENLSERHVAQLRPGQQAQITLRAYPDDVLSGEVESVIPQSGQEAGSNARFTAHIHLNETDLPLLPGMTGRVEVMVGEE
jgi:multidrug resistance efflux pump